MNVQLEIDTNPAAAFEQTMARPAAPPLLAWRVYSMALIYLSAGLAIGYLLRVSRSPVVSAGSASIAGTSQPRPNVPIPANPPSLGELKRMADDQAAPLLEKLKNDSNNSALLMQLGAIYHSAHQFKEAAAYYDKAAQADSKNVAARNKLAISLYRSGDVDGALAQLNRTLHDDPGDANSLFNLGMIRLQGKHDGAGAVAAWQKLLKLNPQLSEDRKVEVQKLMADVLTSLGGQNRKKGAGNNDQSKPNSY
jgi:cytochrome c-type biogenesis protein CcmH/NrfG